MPDEKLPAHLESFFAICDICNGQLATACPTCSQLRLAINRYAREREAAALEREDAASRSAMPPEELAEEPASIVALSRLADQAAAHGWDEAAGHLRTAARSLSSAHCNLQTCSEALAECNVRPSNIKWASDAASAIRALIHKEPANG